MTGSKEFDLFGALDLVSDPIQFRHRDELLHETGSVEFEYFAAHRLDLIAAWGDVAERPLLLTLQDVVGGGDIAFNDADAVLELKAGEGDRVAPQPVHKIVSADKLHIVRVDVDIGRHQRTIVFETPKAKVPVEFRGIGADQLLIGSAARSERSALRQRLPGCSHAEDCCACGKRFHPEISS